MILAAFAIYLFTATADDGFGGFRGAIEQARRALISASSTEIRPLYRCLVAVLGNGPAAAIREAAVDNRWQLVWERALASVIARLVRPDADAISTNLRPEQIARWIQELPRELSAHASNMEFALTYQLLKPAVLPAEVEKQLRDIALQRADDETVGVIRWLLTDFPAGIDKLPTWYVWTLLRGTALRPTYLAWKGTIELAARAETFGKRMTQTSRRCRPRSPKRLRSLVSAKKRVQRGPAPAMLDDSTPAPERARSRSAQAIVSVGEFVLSDVIVGIAEASISRSRSMPRI